MQSLRKMATEFGTSEGTIRRRAKQYGWVRDGSMVKRERVKAHFAGKPAPKSPTNPKRWLKRLMRRPLKTSRTWAPVWRMPG
nr:hypothetical protein [Candidatus Hamiltonella defensa]